MVSNETTIKDLLCHRVGLGTFSGDIIWYKSDFTSEEIIKRAKYLDKAFDFRDGYGYSNLMYITAGEIIKKVTGKTWGENLQERIFNPLDMNRSIYSLKKLDEKGNYATPHALRNSKNIPIGWENWEEIGALGGVISSVNDIAKWMIFNMNHGIIGKDTLISKASRNLMWTPHNNFTVDHTSKNDFNKHFSGYGLGWSLSDYHGKLQVSHTGGYDGMISAVTMIPDEKLGIVVLTNGSKSPIMAATYYALDHLLNVEKPKDWSAYYLARANKKSGEDERVTKIKQSRVLKTKPTLSLEKYAGTYYSDIHGNIFVKFENNQLKLSFERAKDLSATLSHWHYDVFELKWDQTHAWFDFGTIQFKLDNKLNITELEFEVPNYDIFFEELKPRRID
jgi:CubicO group peptidase (beta-lactamase class C family)